MEKYKILKDLVKFNTIKDKENKEIIEYIEELKNPFELILKDGYLYGLGACDMKGGIAAMLDAVSNINFINLKNGMKLYFTYDEEIGFTGIYELVKNKVMKN